MRIETVTPHAVSLRIGRTELNGKETLTFKAARNAVLQALSESGQHIWEHMDLRIISRENEIVVLAHPITVLPCRFRFDSFFSLVAAAVYIPQTCSSDLIYYNEGYELLLYPGNSAVPNALYEFGNVMPSSWEMTAHILEQGEIIEERYAAEMLKKAFL